MPILANAKKALRSSKKKALVNRRIRSRVKTLLDAVVVSPTVQNVSDSFSTLDKAVKRNIMHKNKAARIKSRLAKLELVAADAPKVTATKKTAVKKTATKKTTVKKTAKTVKTAKTATKTKAKVKAKPKTATKTKVTRSSK